MNKSAYKKLVNCSQSAIVYTNTDLNILYVNEAWVNQTQYSPLETYGKTPKELLTGPMTSQAKLKKISNYIEKGISLNIDIVNYRKDRSPYTAFLEISPIITDDIITGWMCVSTDITTYQETITQLKSNNKALQSLIKQKITTKRKSDFSALSHDLRNIIHKINASLELISTDKLLKEDKILLQRAIKTAGLATDFLDDIITTHKNATKPNSVLLEDINVLNLLKQVVNVEFQDNMDLAKNITFSNNLKNHIIKSNKNMLSRIFSNIISNARKYCNETFTLKVQLIKLKKSYKLSFVDNGVGMSEKTKQNALRPFQRGENTNIHGHGLGLNIIKKFCDDLNIELVINTIHGKGTSVVLKYK